VALKSLPPAETTSVPPHEITFESARPPFLHVEKTAARNRRAARGAARQDGHLIAAEDLFAGVGLAG